MSPELQPSARELVRLRARRQAHATVELAAAHEGIDYRGGDALESAFANRQIVFDFALKVCAFEERASVDDGSDRAQGFDVCGGVTLEHEEIGGGAAPSRPEIVQATCEGGLARRQSKDLRGSDPGVHE